MKAKQDKTRRPEAASRLRAGVRARVTTSTMSAGLAIGIVLTGAAAAHALDGEQVYGLDHTAGLGAYPRSTPAYEARTGTALPESTDIVGECFGFGETITNYWGYSSDVWVRSSSHGHTWFPEAWLETGSEGVPAGLPSCDDLDAGAVQSSGTTEPAYPRTDECQTDSEYFDGAISTTYASEDDFVISFAPTEQARYAVGRGYGWDASVEMWHQIQDCVPGLYDGLADSIFQQLECHQIGAAYVRPDGQFITGPTYDLESAAPPLNEPYSLWDYMISRCGNA